MRGNKINGLGIDDLARAIKQVFDSEGTDKTLNDEGKTWGHSYKYTYASQFMRLYARHITGNPVRIAEIGVQRGNSMRAMRRMLPFAQIYGFDSTICQNYLAGATLLVGDAYASEIWKAVPADFDLIIDDGSHKVEDMLRGIPNFVAHLRPGGVLMIEDITSAEAAGRVMDKLPGSELVDTRDTGRGNDDLIVLFVKPS